MKPFQSQTLEQMLQKELASGNRVVDDGPGWGSMIRLVILEKPFVTPVASLPAELSWRDVNDPHYWKTEVVDRVSQEMLACRFGP